MNNHSFNIKRRFKITIIMLLLIQCSLNLEIVSAGSIIEYSYDNHDPSNEFTITSGGTGEVGIGVHFTASEVTMLSTNQTILTKIRFYTNASTFVWRVSDWDGDNSLPGSTVLASGTASPTQTGWFEIEVGPLNVSREFFVGFYNSTPVGGVTGYLDSSDNVGRSKVVSPAVPVTVGNNWLIRAVVVLPVNLQDLLFRLAELESDVAVNQDKINGLNSTVGVLDARVDDCCNVTQFKLNQILGKIGLPVGGFTVPLEKIPLAVDYISDNLSVFALLALFTVAITWITRKNT